MSEIEDDVWTGFEEGVWVAIVTPSKLHAVGRVYMEGGVKCVHYVDENDTYNSSALTDLIDIAVIDIDWGEYTA